MATMKPAARKAALTAHVVSSVGWLGAVVVFLTLALVGLLSSDFEVVRSVYIAMNVAGWFVLVPLCAAAFVTGVIQSLGTPWGLFRHYWVIVKLTITVLATGILLMYTQTLGYFSDIARSTTSPAGLPSLQSPSPVLHGVGALVLLLAATVFAIYKPKGLTKYGHRKQQEQRAARAQ